MAVLLTDRLEFPNPCHVATPDGLVAVGGDLSVERLMLAYQSGIFPWSAQPVTWWSPDPRAVFEFDRLHFPRTLQRTVKQSVILEENEPLGEAAFGAGFGVTFNRAFRQVIEGCATRRTEGNWISLPFIEAYTRLHEAGHAHSVECWRAGELAGGVYGVAVVGLFAAESMFYRASNASKTALWFLLLRLRERGFALVDIQMLTETTRRLGATPLSRKAYIQRLEHAVNLPVTFVGK